MRLSPYIRLMRLHQPVGIWLLLWPCWWSIALASPGFPSFYLLTQFAFGAVLMRSAGCIINDIADRKIDRQVERTRERPLASGELKIWQALVLLFILLLLAFGVAIQLGVMVVLWSTFALVPIVNYPFMKRISWWPQLFLGLTFNWGALVGWVAVRDNVELPAILLYIACVFWTLGYDTIYAHQDKKDDERIGVKSTALRLRDNTRPVVAGFYLGTTIALALAGWITESGIGLFSMIILVQMHFGWQLCEVDLDDPASCRRIFVSNIYMGALVFIGCIVGHY